MKETPAMSNTDEFISYQVNIQRGKEERIKKVFAYTAGEQVELLYRQISSLSFIVIILVFGIPLWWQTTSTYRVPFQVFPTDQQINLPIHITIASSHSSMKAHIDRTTTQLLNKLSDLPEIERLHMLFRISHENMDNWKDNPNAKKEDNGLFGIHIAVLDATAWSHPGYTTFLSDQWTYVLYCGDEEKLAQRMLSVIVDIFLDTTHLSTVVRRDLKQRMKPREVAALSSSQRKRLIWDSAALSSRYIVQLIFVHTGHNESNENYSAESVVLNARRFARKLGKVSDLSISSEHLWDFDLTPWLKKDVQKRDTISVNDIPEIVSTIEQETSTVEASAPVMKLAILDAAYPIILLDQMDKDSSGVVVASWGALFSYDGKKPSNVDQSVIAAMRVMFGLDTQFPVTTYRSPLPVAEWEISRIKLRSFIDCSINGISSVTAIDNLMSEIDNIVISDEVALKTNLAVKLISQAISTVEKTGRIEVHLAVKGRALAESALNDKSLLALMYFPSDQKFAIYLPLFLPTLLPLLGSLLTSYKYWIDKE